MLIPIEQLKESSFYQYILEEGHQEGRQEGEVFMLGRMLEHRFGALPDWASNRIEAADLVTLEKWSILIIDAASLEDALA